MSIPVVFALLVLTGFGVLVWYFQGRSEKRLRRRFEDREELSMDQLWRMYYAHRSVSLAEVEEVFRVVATAVGTTPSVLRPSDQLIVEYGPEKGWEFDHGLEQVRWWFDEKLAAAHVTIEVPPIRTLDDLVCVYHLVSRGERP